jgi:hypothetical protein
MSAADRFTRPEKRLSSGRGEGLLDPLPLVLPDGVSAQQAMQVVPAPLIVAGPRSSPHGSLEQEVPECSQR